MSKHDDLSRLYHEADLPEPPQALDEAILAAAHNAATQSAGKPVRRLQQWRVPLALAATVILSVGVTSMVLEQQPHNAPFPATNIESPAKFNDQQPASTEARGASPRMDEPVARPAYAPMMKAERDAAKAEQEATLARSSANENMAADKVAQPALELAAPAPEAKLSGASNSATVAPASAAASEGSVDSAAAPALRDQRAKALEVRKETGIIAAQMELESPEHWIANIRELKRSGHQVEAKAKLIEFKKRFPDYKLPDDLN